MLDPPTIGATGSCEPHDRGPGYLELRASEQYVI